MISWYHFFLPVNIASPLPKIIFVMKVADAPVAAALYKQKIPGGEKEILWGCACASIFAPSLV